MGRSERAKGVAGELEVAAVFRARGFDCDRTPNSGGLRLRGDLLGTVPAHLEVKRQETARVWDWYGQAVADAEAGALAVVAFRRSRSPWLGLLALEELADLLARSQALAALEERLAARLSAAASAAELAPQGAGGALLVTTAPAPACPAWWDRGDAVYYACALELGHEGRHIAVHLESQPPPGVGVWLEERPSS